MSGWHIVPEHAHSEAALHFANLDVVFALEGEIVTTDSLTRTLRVTVGDRRYYVKRYSGIGKKPLRRWFATPRVRTEWENLRHFKAWGIPTAELVAYGLEKRNGRFARGAIVTAEIPNTVDLWRLACEKNPCLENPHWWNGVSRQLAAATRTMHAYGFAHNDLKWRNLLVDAAGKLYLIDCPTGSFWKRPFLGYRIIKDLACLDKVAKYHLSRTRRLRFYLDYAQKIKLDAVDKRRIRHIVRFFEGRE